MRPSAEAWRCCYLLARFIFLCQSNTSNQSQAEYLSRRAENAVGFAGYIILDVGELRHIVVGMSVLTSTPQATPNPASSQARANVLKSAFMAAEEIKGILDGREKAEQERILRWVNESLGLSGLHEAASIQTPSAPASAEALPQTPTGPHGLASPASARPKDMKLFVAEKKPKSDLQFAAVVAYFHRFEAPEPSRKETISAQDLQEAARLSGWSRFRNPSVTLTNAVRQGYIDRAGRGELKLNAVGENLVAMALPGAGSDANDNSPSRPVRKQSKRRRGKINKNSRTS